jgi:hypothetical protein
MRAPKASELELASLHEKSLHETSLHEKSLHEKGKGQAGSAHCLAATGSQALSIANMNAR